MQIDQRKRMCNASAIIELRGDAGRWSHKETARGTSDDAKSVSDAIVTRVSCL